jgi:hypothetical protein
MFRVYNWCRSIVPIALKAVNSYFSHPRYSATWNKGSTSIRGAIREPPKNSSYRDDFAWTGPGNPADIGEKSPGKPMTSTQRKLASQSVSTQMLCQGTTKSTVQIPGFTGHIPINRRIPVKEHHCNGEVLHPKEYNLTLISPVLGRFPGYKGEKTTRNILKVFVCISYSLIFYFIFVVLAIF